MPSKIRANTMCPQCGGPKYPHATICRECFTHSDQPRKHAKFSECPACGDAKHPDANLCRACFRNANPPRYVRANSSCPKCGSAKYPSSRLCQSCQRAERSRKSETVSTVDGLCRCGCGDITPIVKVSRPQRGLIAGQHVPFIRGHAWRKHGDGMNPSGLCQCGCGKSTPLATTTANGQVIGKPTRFINGHRHRKSPIDYLVNPDTGCWEWQLSRNCNGYGQTGRGGKKQGAHRYYYEQHKGQIPKGMEIDHLCRNRGCVNPDHLEAVSHSINLKRRNEK